MEEGCGPKTDRQADLERLREKERDWGRPLEARGGAGAEGSRPNSSTLGVLPWKKRRLPRPFLGAAGA